MRFVSSFIAGALALVGKRGGEGWELVGLNGHIACFKRRAPSANQTDAK